MTLWRRVPAVEPAPLEWGRFILGLFPAAAERAPSHQALTFAWRGYDVITVPAGSAPALLRGRAPAVTDWTAYLVLKDATPVGVALGPTGAAPGAPWASVLFDGLAVDIAVPDYVSTDWTVKHEVSH